MNEQKHTARAPVDQRILQLLNSSIDGEINVVDQQELDHLLATSQSARDLNDELRELTRALDELPEIIPPKYLQDTIERQVRLPVENKGAENKPGNFGSWLNANWLRTGFAVAAGVVLTVGVYEMGSGPIPAGDSASMSGTIASNSVNNQKGELLDRINLESELFSGQVELRAHNDLFTLNIQLESDGASELVINFAGRGLEFESAGSQKDTADTVSVVDGSIHLASNGEQNYVLSLRRVPGTDYPDSLGLEFFANSQLIQQSELRISHPESK